LELQANGSTLSAYLNGTFLFTVIDTTSNPLTNPVFTSGSAGLASNGGPSVFSSFTVTGQ
jgi:hypothetical protein